MIHGLKYCCGQIPEIGKSETFPRCPEVRCLKCGNRAGIIGTDIAFAIDCWNAANPRNVELSGTPGFHWGEIKVEFLRLGDKQTKHFLGLFSNTVPIRADDNYIVDGRFEGDLTVMTHEGKTSTLTFPKYKSNPPFSIHANYWVRPSTKLALNVHTLNSWKWERLITEWLKPLGWVVE